jgi:hypothetical protein
VATRRGDDIIKPDPLDEDLKLAGPPLPGMENVEEELGLPESAEVDFLRKPGQKGYMDTKPMTDRARGGPVLNHKFYRKKGT